MTFDLSADAGIDGTAFFKAGKSDNAKIIFQVKSGGVKRSDVATLRGDIQRVIIDALDQVTNGFPAANEMSSLRAAEELHAGGLTQGSGRRKGLRTDVQSGAAEVFCQFAAQIADDGEQQIIRIAEIGRRVRLRSEAERASDQARIRDLQNQVSMYRQAVDSPQQQLNQHLRMTSILQSPSVTLVRLKATEAGGNASGVALFTDRSGLLFYASNLPAPQPGRTYQLWLIRDRAPLSRARAPSRAFERTSLPFSLAMYACSRASGAWR